LSVTQGKTQLLKNIINFLKQVLLSLLISTTVYEVALTFSAILRFQQKRKDWKVLTGYADQHSTNEY
jgi:hypothetical protein